MDSPHFADAIAAGWSVHELFAAQPQAPANNLSGMGLVTCMALSRDGARLETITEDRAVFRTRSGGTLTQDRFVPRLEDSLPWWEIATLSREIAA